MQTTVTSEIVTRIAAATTFHPAWIAQQLRTVGEIIQAVLASDRYAQVVANEAAKAPLTRVQADLAVFLALMTPRTRQMRRQLTKGQADALYAMLNGLLRADVAALRARERAS